MERDTAIAAHDLVHGGALDGGRGRRDVRSAFCLFNGWDLCVLLLGLLGD